MRTFLKIFLCLVVPFFLCQNASAQNNFKLTVKDEISKESLIGALVQIPTLNIGKTTNLDGEAILDLPKGSFIMTVSYLGYMTKEITIVVPDQSSATIEMKASISETEEVIISSTRTNSRLEDLPSKIEVLGLEDMHEENGIKPGNIASILGDLSVIHIQQTSSVSSGSVVRMQGLGGRYTQLMRDGLPLYDGFSGNLNIMQIPPLDLKQVEIIKGSASTLYGGGSISGMINFISKTPADSTELAATLNYSSLNEANANVYFAKKIGKVGMNLFASHTNQQEADVNKDEFSDVPKFQNVLIHPKFFFNFGKSTDLIIGYSYFNEDRIGGDMKVIANSADSIHRFFEENISTRHTAEIRMEHRFNSTVNVNVKSSWSQLNRFYARPEASLNANQTTGYNEISFLKKWNRHSLVIGSNFIFQGFDPVAKTDFTIESYTFQTVGTFAQLSSKLSEKFSTEAGIRYDSPKEFSGQFLPRISLLFKPTRQLSIRLGSGFGYKLPDPFEYFTIDDLRIFQKSISTISPEKSIGINNDIAYHTVLWEKLSVQFDQAFYYTRINPIVGSAKHILLNEPNQFIQSPGNITSYGTDSYLRLGLHPFELYLGYNHTISQQQYSGDLRYAPRDKFATTLAVEPGHGWRIGVESSWVANQIGAQPGTNDVFKPNYWFVAAMVGYQVKHFRFVLNAENIFDFRQSRLEPLYTGTISSPSFNAIWAPIEGRVINLSVMYRL